MRTINKSQIGNARIRTATRELRMVDTVTMTWKRCECYTHITALRNVNSHEEHGDMVTCKFCKRVVNDTLGVQRAASTWRTLGIRSCRTFCSDLA